ncbi:MAG: VOC family protein [Polaromonas sp.]
MSTAGVLRLARVSRTVSDLALAIAFYQDALDFCVVDGAARDGRAWGELFGIQGVSAQSATLQLGSQQLELVAFDPPGAPYPPQSHSSDLWFQHIAVVVSDMEAAYGRLCAHVFKPISEGGPQTLPPATGSVIAYKFRDPDGHPVELIQFPAGTGNAIWQTTPGLFLGIDHSAMDVANSDESVDFYTRLLGFRLARRSVNAGLAQQRLDGACEDLVEVIALHPDKPDPPHVELLCYRKPAGRPIPKHAQPSGITCDRLVLQVDALGEMTDTLHANNVEFISPGIVPGFGDQGAALVRDPTRHLLLLCG